MERKIADRYIDNSYGFPVELLKVELVNVRGTWAPKVDYKKFAKKVLEELCKTSGRFSGNHIRFIRQYFELTLKDFSSTFNVTHPAVIKWEKNGDKLARMDWSMEKDIRLFALKKLGASYTDIGLIYECLQHLPLSLIVGLKIGASSSEENKDQSNRVSFVFLSYQRNELFSTSNQTLLSAESKRIHINTAENSESKEFIFNGAH